MFLTLEATSVILLSMAWRVAESELIILAGGASQLRLSGLSELDGLDLFLLIVIPREREEPEREIDLRVGRASILNRNQNKR